jgi:hypothetical protein
MQDMQSTAHFTCHPPASAGARWHSVLLPFCRLAACCRSNEGFLWPQATLHNKITEQGITGG